jgi:multisubunit Na+/H+ antiporter MnhC subunit
VAISALLLAFALKTYEHQGTLDPGEVVEMKG